MKPTPRQTSSLPSPPPESKPPQWTFLTNHFQVMVSLSRDPYSRIRDLSDKVEITQRAVQRILAKLVDGKVLQVRKEGRRNHYTINRRKRLRHHMEDRHNIGELLDLLS